MYLWKTEAPPKRHTLGLWAVFSLRIPGSWDEKADLGEQDRE